MWLLIPFVAIPLIEIALFIQVGGFLGMWWTLAIVLATAILGSWLVRTQGARELANLRGSLSELRDPTEPLASGAMILFSGALLLTPGFFTDAVGFALLVPGVRKWAYLKLRKRVHVAQFQMGPQMREPGPAPRRGDTVIDGEFEDVTVKHEDRKGPSGWTRH